MAVSEMELQPDSTAAVLGGRHSHVLDSRKRAVIGMMAFVAAARDACMVPYWYYHRLRRNSVLKPMFMGRRVLIAGTGPSAAELGWIPDDVLICTCKDGLHLFAERTQRSRVDVYASIGSRLRNERRLPELFARTRPRVFISSDVKYVRRSHTLRGLYSRLVYDSGEDNGIVRKLIAPLSVRDIRGNAFREKISTGMRLLHYAVYFGAREIYLIGIDLGHNGYVWGERKADRPWNHADIDENFIKIMSTRYTNLFTLSSDSPIARYLPYRRLCGRENCE
jgi:hypothetical protein